jgi:hypothetical protein
MCPPGISFCMKIKPLAVAAPIVVAFVASLLFWWDFRFGGISFRHPDVLWTYFPLRYWFIDQLRHGRFPLWNPYWGLGRPIEVWTTVPLDVLAPIQLFLNFRPIDLFITQLMLVTYASFLSAKFVLGCARAATAGVCLFLLAPWTHYFLYYYIHAWWYAFFALGLAGIVQCNQGRIKLGVPLIAASVALGILSAKAELSVYAVAMLGGFSLVAPWFSDLPGRKQFRVAVWCFAAIATGVSMDAWQINLIYQSAREAARTPPDWNLGHFVTAVANSFDGQPMGVVVLLTAASFVLGRFLWRTASRLTLGLLIMLAMLWTPFGPTLWTFLSHPVGWGSAAAVALCLISQVKRVSPIRWDAVLLGLSPFIVYWGRKGRGDLGELELLQQTPATFQVVLGFLIVLGIAISGRKIVYALAMTAGIGLLLRTHLQPVIGFWLGVIWAPTRDNFLFDFLFAIQAAFGMEPVLRFLRHRRPTHAPAAQWIVVAAAIIVAIAPVVSRMHAIHPAIERGPSFETTARQEMQELKSLRFEDPRTARILKFTHTSRFDSGAMAIMSGVADVR